MNRTTVINKRILQSNRNMAKAKRRIGFYCSAQMGRPNLHLVYALFLISMTFQFNYYSNRMMAIYWPDIISTSSVNLCSENTCPCRNNPLKAFHTTFTSEILGAANFCIPNKRILIFAQLNLYVFDSLFHSNYTTFGQSLK